MFKKLIKILSCVSIIGVVEAMDKEDVIVDNPIPLLIQEVSPNFLQAADYEEVSQVFEKSVLNFKEEFIKATKLENFPEQLRDQWVEKLGLLKETCDSLKTKKEINEKYEKLMQVTDNGFLTEGKVAIYGTENAKELNLVLDDFWLHLWQAREITEYLVILDRKQVLSSEIPEICEACDKSISYIRKSSISDETKEEALKIERVLNKILLAYQYMDFGKAVKTTENLKIMEKMFKNSNLSQIMIGAFDSARD